MMDETRQFLYLSLGLLGLADALIYLSISVGLNEKIEVIGYCLAVLSFVIIGALGGKENGKTASH